MSCCAARCSKTSTVYSVVGAAFVLATVLRLFLPERMVGLLHVRSRAVDVACLAVLGAGILVLALLVPAQK